PPPARSASVIAAAGALTEATAPIRPDRRFKPKRQATHRRPTVRLGPSDRFMPTGPSVRPAPIAPIATGRRAAIVRIDRSGLTARRAAIDSRTAIVATAATVPTATRI